MFGLMKSKNPYEQVAHDVYGAALEQSRDPAFFTDYGVEDNFEGRFEVLCLHIFIIMHVILADGGNEEFNQAVFDIMFADIDQALRQTGKGDMGVPKHMRRMMKGFNGRMNAYEEAFANTKEFEKSILRNLYADEAGAPAKDIAKYIKKNVKKQTASAILQGRATFAPITSRT